MKTLLRPLVVLALAGLAACSNSGEEAETPTNSAEVVQEIPAPAEAPLPVETAAPPAETTADANAAVPADEEPSADEQMLDDASATGMTARSSRGDEEAETQGTANETE